MPNKESNEFDKAFAEAVGEEPEKDEEKLKEEEAKKELEEEEVKSEQDADEVFVATPDPDLEEEEEQKETPAAEVCSRCTKLETELAQERQKTSSWDGRIRTANDRTNELQTELDELKARAPAKEEDSPDADLSNDDEVIAKFKDEFPDFVRPLEIMAQRIAGKEVKTIEPVVQALQEDGEATAQRLHTEAIENAHPGFLQLAPKVKTWITTQPSFLQASLEAVFQKGTATEVIEMFDTYKRVHNITTHKPKEEKQTSKNAEELLAVPASPGPTPEVDAKDQQDFNAGWDEANPKK